MRIGMMVFAFILSACQPLTQVIDTPPVSDPTTWQQVAEGLSVRIYQPTPSATSALQAVRINPTIHNFRVHYQPDQPLSINEWQQALPDALVIVNANFFTPENTALGLLVSDGIIHGSTYVGRGGTFAVQNGDVAVYSTTQRPYRGEAFDQAIQAFPMFIADGQQVYADRSQQRITRRTVIGQDSIGQIILMVTPGFGLGLYDLARYLPQTDIGFVNAFNLDGGGSSMLHVAPADVTISSLDRVPAVLAIYQSGD